MPPKSPSYLVHMMEAASCVQQFIQNRQGADLSTDPMLRSAVYYQLAIIGEALTKLRETDPATAARITDARKIVGFRNQIVHGYAVIRDDVTWKIIQEHLPVLQSELTTLMAEAGLT